MPKFLKVLILVILFSLTLYLISAFKLLAPFATGKLDFYLTLLIVLSFLTYTIYLINPPKPILITQLTLIFLTYLILKIIGLDLRIGNRFAFILYSILLASSYHFIDYTIFIKSRIPYLRLISYTLFGSLFFTINQILIHILINQPLNKAIILYYLTNFLFIFILAAISRIIHSAICEITEQKSE